MIPIFVTRSTVFLKTRTQHWKARDLGINEFTFKRVIDTTFSWHETPIWRSAKSLDSIHPSNDPNDSRPRCTPLFTREIEDLRCLPMFIHLWQRQELGKVYVRSIWVWKPKDTRPIRTSRASSVRITAILHVHFLSNKIASSSTMTSFPSDRPNAFLFCTNAVVSIQWSCKGSSTVQRTYFEG